MGEWSVKTDTLSGDRSCQRQAIRRCQIGFAFSSAGLQVHSKKFYLVPALVVCNFRSQVLKYTRTLKIDLLTPFVYNLS